MNITHQTPQFTTSLIVTQKGYFEVKQVSKKAIQLHLYKNIQDAQNVFNRLVDFAKGERKFIEPIAKHPIINI